MSEDNIEVTASEDTKIEETVLPAGESVGAQDPAAPAEEAAPAESTPADEVTVS